MADASAIATVAMESTVAIAAHRGTGGTLVRIMAEARAIQARAVTMAILRAELRLARISRICLFARTHAVRALASSIAFVGAKASVTRWPIKPWHADTLAHDTCAVATCPAETDLLCAINA